MPTMNQNVTLDRDYIGTMKEIIQHGTLMDNRTGVATIKHTGALGISFNHLQTNDKNYLPVLTTKQVNYKAVLAELLWFINGDTSGKELLKETSIWKEWTSSSGSVGPMYGAMWRRRPVSIASGMLVDLEDLISKYNKEEYLSQITHCEKDEIEYTIKSNDNEFVKAAKDSNDPDYFAWVKMLEYCFSRYMDYCTDFKIEVDKNKFDTHEEAKEWLDTINKHWLMQDISYNMFGSVQSSSIYKPWLVFENFKKDVSRIPYNEARFNNVNSDDNVALTTFFHGVLYYSPWTTVFNVRLLSALSMLNARKIYGDVQYNRPIVYIDQLSEIIQTLKTNPDSRRMVVSSWEPSLLPNEKDTPSTNPDKGLMALAPCHHDWQVTTHYHNLNDLLTALSKQPGIDSTIVDKFNSEYNACIEENNHDSYKELYSEVLSVLNRYEEKNGTKKTSERYINLYFTMRSTDIFLGLPFNIASYGTLLYLLAREVNMDVGGLFFQSRDLHLYNNHLEQAKIQIERELKQSPHLVIKSDKSLFDLTLDDFELVDYNPDSKLTAKVSV